MEKTKLRNNMITSLKKISEQEKKEIENQLIDHLLNSEMWAEAKIVGITVSQGFEWDTKSLIEAGWQQGKTITVPKCIPSNKTMKFYKLEHFGQLEKSYYNLLEPIMGETVEISKSQIELLIVPGLLFDPKGYRIGFGGGYYDRFLADFPNETASLAHTSQIKDQLPLNSFDIPVRHIITESGGL